jgi:cystathionine beta-lyase/cystathionine gamma-synthase
MPEFRTLATRAVHAGSPRTDGAVVTPIFQTANYLQEDVGDYAAVRYLRLSNGPQHLALHAKLAALEEAEAALSFGSGMAAISTALLSALQAGDHALVQHNVYGGTQTLLEHDLKGLGITHTAVDAARPDTWDAALQPRTRVFYVEGISNPLLGVPDLEAVVAFCRRHGLASIIDNTFPSPVNFRPIPFGFDLVVHSATKYLNGHSDLVAGVVAGSAERVGRVLHRQNHLGGCLDAHAAFLLDRGLKTLHLRVERQNANAGKLAAFLAGHPSVAEVRYPGLPDDPSHGRARRWMAGFGGMLAFRARDAASAERFLARVRIALHAASLGGVESLVVRPSRSSHLGMSPEARAALGIDDALIRVSVGVEDADELIEDFGRALTS